MANDSGKSSRYRITVPANDTTVLRWIESQSSLSMSVRMLIRWAVHEYGNADVTCLGVKRGRGRPNGTVYPMEYESSPDYFDAQRAVPPQPVYPMQQPVSPVSAPQPAPQPFSCAMDAPVSYPSVHAVQQVESQPAAPVILQPSVAPSYSSVPVKNETSAPAPVEDSPSSDNEPVRNIPGLEDLLI